MTSFMNLWGRPGSAGGWGPSLPQRVASLPGGAAPPERRGARGPCARGLRRSGIVPAFGPAVALGALAGALLLGGNGLQGAAGGRRDVVEAFQEFMAATNHELEVSYHVFPNTAPVHRGSWT